MPTDTAKQAAHTSGPWIAFHCDDEEAWKVRDLVGCIVTDCGMSDMTLPTDEANARLIAAAPCLLQALTLILPLAKGYSPEGQSLTARRTCNEWVTAAEDAIAKATGAA